MSSVQDVKWPDRGTPAGTSQSASGRLPHIGVVRFAGPDAVSFLQGQVSNDARPLAEGAPILAAYSSPQGRVVGVLHLLPHSSGVIGLMPRDIVTATLERLRKFVLRAKVKVEDLSEQYVVSGVHGGEALRAAGTAVPGADGYVEQDGIGVCRVSSGADRYWMIGPADGPARSAVESGSEAQRIERDWRLADIRAGLPQVYAATSEMFVAQMLNLDLINGISFSKGCYTGQEIIARTQHLGRIKRRMFRLRLPPGTWSVGQALRLTDGRTGRLTELAPLAEEFEALAVLNLGGGATDAESAPSDAVSAAELPLPYALA